MKFCINHPTKKILAKGLCGACYQKAQYNLNPQREKRSKNGRIWSRNNYLKNPEKCREMKYSWNKANPDKATKIRRRHSLKKLYGITLEEYDAMFAKQGGLCAICGLPPHSKKSLCIDHSHNNGSIRGLVHHSCNMAIAVLEKNPTVIKNIINYLNLGAT